jgi:hypothetical protein
MLTLMRCCEIAWLGAVLLAEAQAQAPPLNQAFFGIWKENTGAETQDTRSVTFERKADGIHMGADPNGFAYDGVERPVRGFQATSAWKKTGARAYESISKTNGKLQYTVTRQISEDGNTMTVVNIQAATGSRTVSVWTRVGASADSDPLIGTWKRGSLKTDSPTRLIIESHGDAISVTNGIPGRAAPDFTAKFDGRDYPSATGGKPGAFVVYLKRISDRSFVQVVKLPMAAGQPFMTFEYVLSLDGKTLQKTMTLNSGTNKPTVIVYDRQ